jgi:hypothetical protein
VTWICLTDAIAPPCCAPVCRWIRRASTSWNVTGGRRAGTGTCSVSTVRHRSRARNCGWSTTSAASFTCAAGTPARASPSVSSALGQAAVKSASTAWHCVRLAARATLVANVGRARLGDLYEDSGRVFTDELGRPLIHRSAERPRGRGVATTPRTLASSYSTTERAVELALAGPPRHRSGTTTCGTELRPYQLSSHQRPCRQTRCARHVHWADGRSPDTGWCLMTVAIARRAASRLGSQGGSPDPRPDPGSARHRPDLHHLHRPRNYAQIVEVWNRVNVVEHGQVTVDKPASSTSLAELTDLMVTEYRKARKQIALEAGRSTVLKHKALASRSPSFGAHDI